MLFFTKKEDVNVEEERVKIVELNQKLEKAKEARSKVGYGISLYYEANEKYIAMVEKELLERLKKLPQKTNQNDRF